MSDLAICQGNGVCSYLPKGKSTVEIDNSMVDQHLSLTSPSDDPLAVTLRYKNRYGSFKEKIPSKKSEGMVQIRIVDLLTRIPPQGEGRLTIQSGKTIHIIQVKRKGIVPEKFKDLIPLYFAIAEDIKKNGYFIATTVVNLWDASFTGAGRGSRWADGTDPETNLNWGWGAGIVTILKKRKGWKLVQEEKDSTSPIRTMVFAQKVSPSAFWKALGVTQPFTIYLILLAFDYREIKTGYEYFAKLTSGTATDKITLPDGKSLDLSQSRITGLATHFIPQGGWIFAHHVLPPASPKGVFVVSCFSATQFGPLLMRDSLYPLLYSIHGTSAEGYTYLPLIEGITKGHTLKQLLADVSSLYYQFHEKHVGSAQYPNPSSSNFESALSKYDDDWDRDRVSNFIDPEPLTKNPIKVDKVAGKLTIILSSGNPLNIELPPEEFLSFVSDSY